MRAEGARTLAGLRGSQVSPEFAQEKRVPAGLVAQHGGVLPGSAAGEAGLGHQVLGDLVDAEAGQVEPPHPVEPVQVSDGIGELITAIGRGGAVGAQQKQPGRG